MLTHSFIFAPGITEEQERNLWSRGVLDWDTLRKYPGEAADAIGEARSKKLINAVNDAEQAWHKGDTQWFKQHWPEQQTWRLWKGYCDAKQQALVDIETTGRTPGFDQITVIGLSDGTNERAFVADRAIQPDEPLGDFIEAIKPFRLLVTFNGIGFDVPFIEKSFRAEHFTFNTPHIDLMLVARSFGMKGGLKDMEKQAGIARDGDIADMRGNEAIILWGQMEKW